MKLSILAGSTSQTINVFLQDSTSTVGAGKTGLVFNTSGLTAYYMLPKAASVAITLATLSAVTSAYSSGGFKEIDATNAPGWYRLDLPDAAIASGRFSSLHIRGATGLADCPVEIELTGWDNQNAVNGGMSAILIPARTGTAQTGSTTTLTLDLGASSVVQFYTGMVLVLTGGTGAGQARRIASYNGGTRIATVDWPWVTTPSNTTTFAIVPYLGPAVNSSLQVTAANTFVSIHSGTAQTGSTTNTIHLDSTASSTSNIYVGDLINLTGGTGAGQSRTIIAYNGTTKIATVDSNWVTAPDSTTTFNILASTTPSTFSNQGVAQAGGASTITLATTASTTDNIYVGSIVTLLDGTGAGQTREISGYVGSTQVATVSAAWSVNPDSTTGYAVIPAGGSTTTGSAPTVGQISAAVFAGFTFTVADIVDVNIVYVNATKIKGTGASGNEWGPM